MVAEILGVTPPDMAIVTGPNGKPAIRDGGALEISISHTTGVILIAVTEGRRIGVDVEWIQDFEQIDAFTERWFGASDATWVKTTPREARPATFYELWTRAEAYSKARGIGLALDFANAGPFLGSDWVESTESWQLQRLDLGPELAAAAAYSGPRTGLDVLAWTSVEDVLGRFRWCAQGA